VTVEGVTSSDEQQRKFTLVFPARRVAETTAPFSSPSFQVSVGSEKLIQRKATKIFGGFAETGMKRD